MAGFNRRFVRQEPAPEINGRLLKHREVRVVASDGKQLGVLTSREALSMAQQEGMDLVLVSNTATPPVVKIIDYGKHKYLEGKQGRDKKKQPQEVKGIKISPRIAEHDLLVQVKKAIGFLEHGDKVKVTCQFRAREVTHPELGKQKLDAFAHHVSELGTVERTPSLDGRLMIMVLNPKPGIAKKKSDAKAENKQDGGEEVQDHRDREDHSTPNPQ